MTGVPVPPAPAPPAVTDGEWHRVHPLTPAVHSWQALVVLLVVRSAPATPEVFHA